MSPVKSLYHQLLGFLSTPPLWKDQGPINIPQYSTEPVQLSPEVEVDLDIPAKLILGKRVEFFFAYYIENFTSDNLVAQNVVILGERTTIGEIDFLIQNREKEEVTHVELVYKFYLFDQETDSWIGPNRNDSLTKKLNHLQNHQFPLLHREESRKATIALNLIPERVQQKVCFKANLFVPLKMMNNYYFPDVNNECIQGFWIRIEDFHERDYGNEYFHTPGKSNWPTDPSYCEEWYDFVEIKGQLLPFLNAKRSPLVWMKRSETQFFRFFIVWW